MSKIEMSNCSYNVHRQLIKRLQFLHHAKRYIEESKKDGHVHCATMWVQIMENERKNVEMLQDAVDRDRVKERGK